MKDREGNSAGSKFTKANKDLLLTLKVIYLVYKIF
jgi:hypothetical protein